MMTFIDSAPTPPTRHPVIIQGGMGIGLSNWTLANAVARRPGCLGTVSGTSLDQVVTRRLQLGDPGGHVRRAFAHFPCQATVAKVLKTYFIEGGKAPEARFRTPPMYSLSPPRDLNALIALCSFAEVWLAREGHNGPVGMNLLEKILLPNTAAAYGGMLAGVDYILMGAGIPHQMPGILDRLANHEPVAVKVTREDDNESVDLHFDPKGIFEVEFPRLKRPHFLGIVTSPLIAQTILKRAKGPVAGFIVEGYTAGGHNAPPRGQLKLNEIGEPIYGERDIPDMQKFQALGMPYWLAGGMGRPNQLAEAIRSGAYGIQVGTAFAFCKDSGLDDSLRLRVLEKVKNGTAKVFTDPLASPTGFPFKVVELAGTMSEDEVYKSRARVCDIGLLRHPYRKPDGSTGFRCPADDIGLYTKKGGAIEDTERRKCICNGLLATVGLGQVRSAGVSEIPIITAGDDLTLLGAFLKEDTLHYSADDVIDALQGGVEISPEGVATLIEPAPVGN